jgi:anti-sigma factor RsiW
MTIRDHAEYEEAVGAYVLDALPELEAEVFERHLLRCASCREQVERLQTSVDALPRAVPQVPAPPGLKPRLMRQVRDELAAEDAARTHLRRVPRRRAPRALWRPSLAWSTALAAAVVVAFAGYGVFQLADSGSSRKTVSAQVDTNRLAGAASARLDVLDGGDAAILRVSGLPSPGRGRVYQVWLKRGTRFEPVTTFTVNRAGDGSAGIPQGTHGAQAVMVTREEAGGATQPGEAPVIVANV